MHETNIIQSAKKLEYLSLVLLYLIINKKNVLNCQYCYFVDKPYNRITDMNSFSESSSPQDENIFAVEISCHYGSKMWKSSDEEIFSMCIQGLEKDNFLKKADVINYKVIKVPSVYPIYRKDYDNSPKKQKNILLKLKTFSQLADRGSFIMVILIK